MNKPTATILILLTSACASGLTQPELNQLQWYEQKGLKVQECNESTAGWMGLLPGGGSFYVGDLGLGILNLLTWPLSITWDPVSAKREARKTNLIATRAHVETIKQDEFSKLGEQLRLHQINSDDYQIKHDEIDRKYTPR